MLSYIYILVSFRHTMGVHFLSFYANMWNAHKQSNVCEESLRNFEGWKLIFSHFLQSFIKVRLWSLEYEVYVFQKDPINYPSNSLVYTLLHYHETKENFLFLCFSFMLQKQWYATHLHPHAPPFFSSRLSLEVKSYKSLKQV